MYICITLAKKAPKESFFSPEKNENAIETDTFCELQKHRKISHDTVKINLRKK